MRPLPGDDVYSGRSRSTSFEDNDLTPLATRSQPPQMTYFLAHEDDIGDSQHSPSAHPKQRESGKSSTYGVESLETTISSLDQDSDDQEEKVRSARHNWKTNLRREMSRPSEEDLAPSASPLNDISRNTSPSHQRRPSQATISRPFTPLSFGSPAPPSLMSSPDSRRSSDAGSLDDIASQAIISSGDEEREMGSELIDSGSAPQLVMPSIKMPSRRPFTERGKNMGKLKVLIAGDSGVGKTSLIKAIVQTCEDIVHVDPLSTTSVSIPETPPPKRSKSRSRRVSADVQTTLQITEVCASTRPYPAWWSGLEESQILRRRKSMGDSVLERNFCFVDTPGYGNKTSCLESITPVVDYVEGHLQKAVSMQGMGESEMISMLSGNGGSQVDLVFYLFTQRVRPVDIEYLRRLSPLTNIIPLISHSDIMSTEQLSSLKENISSELQSASIKPFIFGQTFEGTPPFSISTQPSKDNETMDASLLMSPDYIQPLLPSELTYLVSQIFIPDTMSWLRHSAAKKCIAWHQNSSPISKPQSLYRPLTSSFSSSISQNQSQLLTPPVGATTSYALARITDHTQREERMAQVRLANWAADLQRSLRNERARFEALARSERAVWLTERLGECVQDGTIVPLSQARQHYQNTAWSGTTGALVKHERPRDGKAKGDGMDGMDVRDPLGLLRINEEMKRKGWIALQVVSSFGVIGGLALWVSRGWNGNEGELGIWGLDWTGFHLVDWK